MDQPEGDVRPLRAVVADAEKALDQRSLGDVIRDALDDWFDLEPFVPFPQLLLERLAAAGFVVRKAGD